MKTILTAEEFLNENRDIQSDFDYETVKVMIEFTKLHVQAALKEASENAKIFSYVNMAELDKESILNAYPLTNIK